MKVTDFFDVTQGPPRDKHGRPLLIPRGGTEDDRQWYTRASSLGDTIENFAFLHKWKMRYLAVGLSRNMDLIRLAATEIYTTGFGKGDSKENTASGKRIDDVIDRALERAKIHEKADYGTAVHARTEPGNQGVDPDEMQAIEVQSFWDLVAELGIVIIGTELFTANDEVRTAGTFDHLMYVPGYGIIITDKKTSSKASESYDVQLSVYANADLYDYETDQRTTLEDYVRAAGWDPALINREDGLIFWIKNGRTQTRFLDLKKGYQAARVAAWVRDEHHTKGTAKDVTKEIRVAVALQRAQLLEFIQSASGLDILGLLWNDRRNQAIWTDAHTEAAKKRKAELT